MTEVLPVSALDYTLELMHISSQGCKPSILKKTLTLCAICDTTIKSWCGYFWVLRESGCYVLSIIHAVCCMRVINAVWRSIHCHHAMCKLPGLPTESHVVPVTNHTPLPDGGFCSSQVIRGHYFFQLPVCKKRLTYLTIAWRQTEPMLSYQKLHI